MVKDSSRGLSSVLEGGADTIVARATPNGRSALAIVRVSGQNVAGWAKKVTPKLRLESSWKAQLVAIYDRNGQQIERGVAIPYRAPRSYTGEDMVELIVHGSTFLVHEIIEASIAAGCRVAEPGEFTRRAVSNGKMDLIQAGAVREMIEAETGNEARRARGRLHGELSKRIGRLRKRAVEMAARVEAAIEYSDQGVEVSREDLERAQEEIMIELKGIELEVVAKERGSRKVRAVISGSPNAGKSTLFNYIVGWERAIVDDAPGTTRDVIEADIEIAGVDVKVVDTAGVREGGSRVEGEGVRRALRTAADADIEIVVSSVEEVVKPEIAGDRVIKVRSKVDMGGELWEEDGWIPVSVKEKNGLERFWYELKLLIAGGKGEIEDRISVTKRQRQKLTEAVDEIEGCDFGELEMAAERIRWVEVKLSEIVGEIDDEEMLDEVFSGFCIGK
jgi:tRNA modification GTPase